MRICWSNEARVSENEMQQSAMKVEKSAALFNTDSNESVLIVVLRRVPVAAFSGDMYSAAIASAAIAE